MYISCLSAASGNKCDSDELASAKANERISARSKRAKGALLSPREPDRNKWSAAVSRKLPL